MLSYTVRRLLAMIPVILITTSILFAFFFLLPGDPVRVATGGDAGKTLPENIRKNIEEKFQLDKPWYVQYGNYMQNLTQGDFGSSTRSSRPVSDIIKEKVPPSLRLAAWAILIETVVGVGVGIIAAVYKYSFWDVLTTVVTTMFVGIPVFILGFLLQYAFGVLPAQSDLPYYIPIALAVTTGAAVVAGIVTQVRRRSIPKTFAKQFTAALGAVMKWWVILILPIIFTFVLLHGLFGWFDGRVDYPSWYQLRVSDYPSDGWFLFFFPKGDGWRYLILPAVTLASISTAIVARLTRTSMLEVMDMDYVRTATAKGVSHNRVVFRHVLRNALIPVVTFIGIDLGTLIGSAILTETVFSWPGMGTAITDSIGSRDMPTALGLSIVVVFIFLIVNLIVDLSYAAFDPRLRRSMGEETG